MTTLELIENIRTGHGVTECEAHLYDATRAAILDRLRSKMPARLRSRLDAEDVLHEAFLRAMRALDLFKPTSDVSFFAWIWRIARNLLHDESRRRSVAALRLGGGSESGKLRSSLLSARARRPETQVQREEFVDSLLGRLKPREAEVIRLRQLEGLSFAEIARRWGKTLGAVQRFYGRALQRCRELAEEAEGEA
jgi:RNA polymerase sigma-70 factor (ECF subfamily)